MKYLFPKEDEKSKYARIEYLYEIFQLYFLSKPEYENKFVVLQSFPFGYIDIFFIIGHDIRVYDYLEKNIDNIKEKNIIAITCRPDLLKKFINRGKEIFVARTNNGVAKIYDGLEWGFNFNITDSEIDLYNNRNKEIYDNIKKSMINIKKL